MKNSQIGSTLLTTLITLAVIIAFLAFAFTRLPQGFKDDLSIIGQGSNIVVLTNKKDSVQSFDLITLLNQVRQEYEGNVKFIVTDVDTPEGKAFARQQRVSGSVLLFFSPSGKRLDAQINVADEKALRMALDKTFGVPP